MSNTPEFINANGLQVPFSLKAACNPKHTALLVYDVQEGIISQIKNKESIIAAMVKVVDAARKAGFKIFFSRHLSLPKKLMGISQIRLAMQWQKTNSFEKISPWFLRDTQAVNIIPQIKPLPDEAVFDKITMSAFEGTYLNIALRDLNIHTLIIIGAAIEVGIEPTAKHAADLGYIPVLIEDACGCGNEAAAKQSLAGLAFAGYTFTANIETICSVFTEFSNAETV